jgi:hypothetical protein
MAHAKPVPGLTDVLQWSYFKSLFQGAGMARGVRTFTYAMVASEAPQIRFEVSKINPLYRLI